MYNETAYKRNKFIKKIGKNIEIQGVKGNAYFMQRCHEAVLKSEKILELGTGTGVVPSFIGYLGKEMVCVDNSANMLKVARRNCGKIKNIKFVKADINKLPFSDNYFDLIIKRLAPDNLIELSRVLKLGGMFLNLTNCELDGIEIRKLFGKPAHLGLNEYRNMLKDNNYKIVKEKVFKFKEIYHSQSYLMSMLEIAPIVDDFHKNKQYYKKIISECFKGKNKFTLTRHKYVSSGIKAI